MPNLTISIPTAAVPDLVALATEQLGEHGISTNGLTNVQIGQRWIAETLKRELLAYRRRQADATRIQAVALAEEDARRTADQSLAQANVDIKDIAG